MEKIFVKHRSDKGSTSKIYKEFCNSLVKNNSIKNRQKELNRYFTTEDIKMANRCIKRCSTSLIIRKMQVKTTAKDHFTPVRMAIIKKIQVSMSLEKKRNSLVTVWWECKLLYLLWKTVRKFLKN
jgi:hypothetical protein